MYKKSGSQWIPTSTAITTSTNSDLYTATYPTSFTAILSDQTTATNFWKSNQLKAEATAVHNKVNLTFAPAAVKVTITIIYEDGSSEATQATISATNIATESGKSSQVVLFRNSDNNGTHTYGFIGIVNPETSGSKYKISIKKGSTTEESKEFNLSDLPDVDGSGGPLSGGKFCAGYNYNYTFTSSTNLILNSVTVTPFGDPISGEDMSAT